MKIIFLNAWQGNQSSQIKDFILINKATTDIFSFQESYLENKPEIFCLDYLSDYQLFFDRKFIDELNHFEPSTFVKKNYFVSNIKTIGLGDDKIGLGLLTQIKFSDNKIINLCNVHGYARPGDKQDTPDRIRQSQLIINSLKNISGPKIIGGDFNLDLNTQSVKIFEDNGYKNLIKDFNITNTRNRLSWEKYNDHQHFADQLFISPEIKVSQFSVPYNEVSDHLPLILEFEI